LKPVGETGRFIAVRDFVAFADRMNGSLDKKAL
jgi:hypothetical protein